MFRGSSRGSKRRAPRTRRSAASAARRRCGNVNLVIRRRSAASCIPGGCTAAAGTRRRWHPCRRHRAVLPVCARPLPLQAMGTGFGGGGKSGCAGLAGWAARLCLRNRQRHGTASLRALALPTSVWRAPHALPAAITPPAGVGRVAALQALCIHARAAHSSLLHRRAPGAAAGGVLRCRLCLSGDLSAQID